MGRRGKPDFPSRRRQNAKYLQQVHATFSFPWPLICFYVVVVVVLNPFECGVGMDDRKEWKDGFGRCMLAFLVSVRGETGEVHKLGLVLGKHG